MPEDVWNFHIGGYQVCEKWLKDRRGRTLTDEDINHYQRVVVAVNETIRLMAEIDRVIEEHGGWPLAGSQDTPKAEAATTLPFAERLHRTPPPKPTKNRAASRPGSTAATQPPQESHPNPSHSKRNTSPTNQGLLP